MNTYNSSCPFQKQKQLHYALTDVKLDETTTTTTTTTTTFV